MSYDRFRAVTVFTPNSTSLILLVFFSPSEITCLLVSLGLPLDRKPLEAQKLQNTEAEVIGSGWGCVSWCKNGNGVKTTRGGLGCSVIGRALTYVHWIPFPALQKQAVMVYACNSSAKEAGGPEVPGSS